MKWLREHFKDYYVRQSKEKKLRSRAWFKLQEIQKKDNILSNGMNVLDLGSAPGSWSQYALKKVGKKGCVVACDILPMKPISGVYFKKGDVLKSSLLNELLIWIQTNNKFQVILSDIASNMSGKSIIDISRSTLIVEKVLKICIKTLTNKGKLLIKIFQGEDFNQCLNLIHSFFKTVKIRKPISSRSRSREVYIVAKEKK